MVSYVPDPILVTIQRYVLSFLRIRSAYAEVGDTSERMEWEWPTRKGFMWDALYDQEGR